MQSRGLKRGSPEEENKKAQALGRPRKKGFSVFFFPLVSYLGQGKGIIGPT